jgi:ribosomal protein S18 acetylase RimI-like enzyme
MEIEVRKFLPADLEKLIRIDHGYDTDYVWQMEMKEDDHLLGVQFRESRLPRSMRVEYPYPDGWLAEVWQKKGMVLTTTADGEVAGYLAMDFDGSRPAALVTDLAVGRRFRRKGIGSSLLQGAAIAISQQRITRLQMAIQTKNHPAICLAKAQGYEFCGYSDKYYPNLDIALFFSGRV